MKKEILLISAVLSLAFVGQANATTYYVDQVGGNDSNTGTAITTPWKTSSKVNNSMSNFKAGDSILFKRGCIWNEQLKITAAQGTAAAYITFGAYTDPVDPQDSKPIIAAQNVMVSGSLAFSSVEVDTSYITVENLEVHIACDANKGRGIFLNRTSYVKVIGNTVTMNDAELSVNQNKTMHGISIYNSNYYGTSNPAINSPRYVTRDSNNFLIKDNIVSRSAYGIIMETPDLVTDSNSASIFSALGYPATIENNKVSDINYGGSGHGDWDAIKISCPTKPETGKYGAKDFKGLIITKNKISNYSEDGIDAYYAGNAIIEYNYIHDPVNFYGNVDNQSGIKSVAPGVIIRYNRIENINKATNLSNMHGIIVGYKYDDASGQIWSYADDAEIYYNTIYNVGTNGILIEPVSNAKAWNNVSVGSPNGLKISYFQGKPTTVEVKNNILKGTSSDLNVENSAAAVIGGNNLLVNNHLTRAGGSSYTGTDLTGTPLFVDEVNKNFHLAAGSQCIDKGMYLDLYNIPNFGDANVDANGNPVPHFVPDASGKPDIGVFEYDSKGTPPPAPNTAPVAQNKSIALSKNASASFSLLATDVEGDLLTYAIVASSSHGTVTGTDVNRTYTPVLNYVGVDSFTFKANDGALDSNIATVTITVTNVNSAPLLASIGNKSVNEGSALSFSLLATDADGDALTYSATGLPSGATFTPSTKTFSWTPGSTQSGNYNVTFTVSDGTVSVSQTITIAVNDVPTGTAPVAPTNLHSISTTKSSITMGWTDNSTNETGFEIFYSLTGLSGSYTQMATVGANVTTFTHSGLNLNTTYFYNVRAVNAYGTTANASMSVTIVNNAPLFASIGNKSVNEGSALSFSLSAMDADGDALTYSATGLPSGATFTPATNTFSWTPSSTQAGNYPVTFSVSDGTVSVPQTIMITVNDVPTGTAPVAPTNLHSISATKSSIKMSWTDNSTNETGFEIFYSLTEVAGSYTQIATVPANATTFTHSGLNRNTKYFYNVRAVNAYGTSGNASSPLSTSKK